MTVQDLIREIDQLPLDAQLLLLETISRRIRQTIKPEAKHDHLRGILATDEPPPSDEEIHDAYVEYLNEKYR